MHVMGNPGWRCGSTATPALKNIIGFWIQRSVTRNNFHFTEHTNKKTRACGKLFGGCFAPDDAYLFNMLVHKHCGSNIENAPNSSQTVADGWKGQFCLSFPPFLRAPEFDGKQYANERVPPALTASAWYVSSDGAWRYTWKLGRQTITY